MGDSVVVLIRADNGVFATSSSETGEQTPQGDCLGRGNAEPSQQAMIFDAAALTDKALFLKGDPAIKD
jgi:hypothetical protein